MLQNLLLTDHMTTPGIKEIYKVNGGGGGGSFRKKAKHTGETRQEQKK